MAVTVLRPRSRLRAVLELRCPRCRDGAVFAGLLRTHSRCPVCGLVLEREPGYFVGAMYVSYALAVPLYAACAAITYLLLPTAGIAPPLLGALVPLLLAAPLLFRYSRVIWIHLDRAIDRTP